MTIDDLAVAAQGEFDHIQEQFQYVHEEFRNVHSEMTAMKHEILHAIEGIDMHLSAYASQWSDDFSQLNDKAEEIYGRLRIVEKRK